MSLYLILSLAASTSAQNFAVTHNAAIGTPQTLTYGALPGTSLIPVIVAPVPTAAPAFGGIAPTPMHRVVPLATSAAGAKGLFSMNPHVLSTNTLAVVSGLV